MSSNPVVWFEIYVDKLDRAKPFYEAVFNISLEELGDPSDSSIQMLALLSNMETYGASGALVKTQDVAAGGNSTLVCFSCADCAAEESRVAAAGGRIERPKMSIGDYGFISMVLDF